LRDIQRFPLFEIIAADSGDTVAVVKLLSKRLEGPKLAPKGPRAQVVLLTADQGFSSIQGILLGFYSI